MYEIEKNVPLPGVVSRYPLDKMQVGDSFLIPAESACDGNWTAREQSRVATAVRAVRETNPGFKYLTRATEDGLRVWRTA